MSENESNKTNNKRFVKARDKYADMKSSAICLLIIGFVGLAVTILDSLNMLPFKLNANNSWLFYIVMYALYIIFIITGIYTTVSAKKVRASISDEESLTDTIIAWIFDNLSAEHIDKECCKNRMDFDELPDELKCFDREAVITEAIKENFNLEDESYISSILEEVYPEIFE